MKGTLQAFLPVVGVIIGMTIGNGIAQQFGHPVWGSGIGALAGAAGVAFIWRKDGND